MLIRHFSQSFHKKGKINIPDGDHFIFDMNLLFFHADNFVHGNKIGPVDPNKPVARKQIFHLFHRLKTHDPVGFSLDGNIIFKPHYIINIIQLYSNEAC